MNCEHDVPHRHNCDSLCLPPGARLTGDVETEDSTLRLDDSRRVLLNELAAWAMSCCSGRRCADEIADEMSSARDEVLGFIAAALDLGWI